MTSLLKRPKNRDGLQATLGLEWARGGHWTHRRGTSCFIAHSRWYTQIAIRTLAVAQSATQTTALCCALGTLHDSSLGMGGKGAYRHTSFRFVTMSKALTLPLRQGSERFSEPAFLRTVRLFTVKLLFLNR